MAHTEHTETDALLTAVAESLARASAAIAASRADREQAATMDAQRVAVAVRRQCGY